MFGNKEAFIGDMVLLPTPVMVKMGSGIIKATLGGIARINIPRSERDEDGYWSFYVFGIYVTFTDPDLILLSSHYLSYLGLGDTGNPHPTWWNEHLLTHLAAGERSLFCIGPPSPYDLDSPNFELLGGGATRRTLPTERHGVHYLYSVPTAIIAAENGKCFFHTNGDKFSGIVSIAVLMSSVLGTPHWPACIEAIEVNHNVINADTTSFPLTPSAETDRAVVLVSRIRGFLARSVHHESMLQRGHVHISELEQINKFDAGNINAAYAFDDSFKLLHLPWMPLEPFEPPDLTDDSPAWVGAFVGYTGDIHHVPEARHVRENYITDASSWRHATDRE